jgi:hypothetical protein
MTQHESHDRSQLSGATERQGSWLPLFLLGIAIALVDATIAIDRDPLSTAEWIGFSVVMMLAFGLELVSFERVD